MSESISRRDVMCQAHGCQLHPVMADQCLFHSRIERRLWGEVTRFLNSPEGSKVIAKSRKVRMLWALGIQNELEQFHPNDEHMFNTYEAFKDVYQGLKRNGALPEIVEQLGPDEALKKFKRYAIEWFDDNGEKQYWTFDDFCSTYETLLIKYVAERSGQKS